ncbi:MAG TPA: hypothetical protein VE591_03130 [Candidatus Acidoferrum sp.]|nr:hypothetical protein [Candidatus Acidoferrum sp.]
MSERVRGSVINIHALGAAVRLEDGRLVAAPIGDVNKNRAAYTRALDHKGATLPFDLVGKMVVLAQTRVDEVQATTPAPALTDPSFEAQINAYLKSTEVWAPPDRPQPFERHLVRKRQRARLFESREGKANERP